MKLVFSNSTLSANQRTFINIQKSNFPPPLPQYDLETKILMKVLDAPGVSERMVTSRSLTQSQSRTFGSTNTQEHASRTNKNIRFSLFNGLRNSDPSKCCSGAK